MSDRDFYTAMMRHAVDLTANQEQAFAKFTAALLATDPQTVWSFFEEPIQRAQLTRYYNMTARLLAQEEATLKAEADAKAAAEAKAVAEAAALAKALAAAQAKAAEDAALADARRATAAAAAKAAAARAAIKRDEVQAVKVVTPTQTAAAQAAAAEAAEAARIEAEAAAVVAARQAAERQAEEARRAQETARLAAQARVEAAAKAAEAAKAEAFRRSPGELRKRAVRHISLEMAGRYGNKLPAYFCMTDHRGIPLGDLTRTALLAYAGISPAIRLYTRLLAQNMAMTNAPVSEQISGELGQDLWEQAQNHIDNVEPVPPSAIP